jgi:hypothetical protein
MFPVLIDDPRRIWKALDGEMLRMRCKQTDNKQNLRLMLLFRSYRRRGGAIHVFLFPGVSLPTSLRWVARWQSSMLESFNISCFFQPSNMFEGIVAANGPV